MSQSTALFPFVQPNHDAPAVEPFGLNPLDVESDPATWPAEFDRWCWCPTDQDDAFAEPVEHSAADDVEHSAYELGYSGECEVDDAVAPAELPESLAMLWHAAFAAGCKARWSEYFADKQEMDRLDEMVRLEPLDERFNVAESFQGH